jgi:ABC-2 type transport system permease protein
MIPTTNLDNSGKKLFSVRKFNMMDSLYIIGNIAAKDILDAIKNRVVVYQIIAMSVLLVAIKGLGLIIQPPATQVMVFDPAGSTLSAMLAESTEFSVHQAASLEELQTSISNMGFGLGAEMGLEIAPGFDLQFEDSEQVEIKGYVSWANRGKAKALQAEIGAALTELVGKPVTVEIEGNIITPPAKIGLLVGIITIFAVTIILNNGIILVPALMIEEKQNHTLDALLVSPASINQVVAGKAIAGAFYVLVTVLIVYLVYWSGVYNWGVTALFLLGAVLFAVSVGLLFGVLFDRQQEMTGWLSFCLVFIIGTIFIELINLDLPVWIEQLLPWIPPVALARIFWASFSSQPDISQILLAFGSVLIFSCILFGIVAWRIKQADR